MWLLDIAKKILGYFLISERHIKKCIQMNMHYQEFLPLKCWQKFMISKVSTKNLYQFVNLQ